MCGYPKTNDPDGVIVGDCDVLEGGVKKPGAPEFTPTVENEGDLIWRDETYIPVQEETDEVILVDNV